MTEAPIPPPRLSSVEFAERLRERSSAAGVPLDGLQTVQFAQYRDLLLEWNEKFNLTAITDDEGVLMRHFVDALTVMPALDAALPNGGDVLDLGTGAGLPGIAIKIARPNVRVRLMDSTAKKLTFCHEVIKQLGLKGIGTLHARAEEAGLLADHRERYDFVVARAVAGLSTLVEYMLPFVKVGGTALAMKGNDAAVEARASRGAIEALGGALFEVTQVTLPGLTDQRALVVIRKVGHTPPQFPRQGGKPRSQPLS